VQVDTAARQRRCLASNNADDATRAIAGTGLDDNAAA
jgi:hypothetical protein